MIIIKNTGITKEELVEANEIQSSPEINRYHSVETHNDHMIRYKRCIYCLLGSRPVPKVQIVEEAKQ